MLVSRDSGSTVARVCLFSMINVHVCDLYVPIDMMASNSPKGIFENDDFPLYFYRNQLRI